MTKIAALAFVLFLVLLPLRGEAAGARLTMRQYTTADGLLSDSVNKVISDSRGFLWFCTSEGLSRFDGYTFRNYTQDDGLPHRNVLDILETSDGHYLVGTLNGLAVFDPLGESVRWDPIKGGQQSDQVSSRMFRTYFPEPSGSPSGSNTILSLVQDVRGNIYAGTFHGLYNVSRGRAGWTFNKIEDPAWNNIPDIAFNVLFSDSRGRIWIAANRAVFVGEDAGGFSKISDTGGNSVFEDSAGRVWVDTGGNDIGLRVFRGPKGSLPEIERTITRKDGLPSGRFAGLLAELDDGLFLGSSDSALFELQVGTGDGPARLKTLDGEAGGATRDSEGNVWLVTTGKGVFRYSPAGFSVLDRRDGLPGEPISSIFSDKRGEVLVASGFRNLSIVGKEDITTIVPEGLSKRSWGAVFLGLESKTGDWWIPSETGLLRYTGVSEAFALGKTRPEKIYTIQDGLYSNEVFGVFEDSVGDVWITTAGGDRTLQKWKAASGKIIRYGPEDGVPVGSGAVSFAEDGDGNIWIAFFFGELLRYRNGKFQSMNREGSVPKGYISQMHTDRNGTLWIATASRGLYFTNNPGDPEPVFTNISTSNGLRSNYARCITEDRNNRVYVGTGQGISRINQEKKVTRTFTRADGLPGSSVGFCFADLEGTLWFGVNDSLARLMPGTAEGAKAPNVFIDEVEINGTRQKVSELGQREISGLELSPDERQVKVNYLSIAPGSGEAIRFQYKLDDQDWSTASPQRSITFNLPNGNHSFTVRAIGADGAVSKAPARLSLYILPPLWQRWWFIIGAIVLLAGGVFTLDRFRVRKTVQAQAALARAIESETRFRTLADTASDAILTIDKESTIVFANRSAGEVFGYESKDLIGRRLTELMPERMRSEHLSGIARFLESGTRAFNWSGVELTGMRSSGEEFPLEVSFGVFEHNGETYFTGVSRDITERKRAERALNEAREEKLTELQRIRERIASDLHDDIGSSLTQIAVLSEVARNRVLTADADEAGQPLERIKTVSRELVAVMSDIVWAINPKKDHLHDLVQRMRRFASDVLSGKNIRFDFHAPAADDDLQLGANIRREVFAMFKESINNAARHSRCNAVTAEFRIEPEGFVLTVSDDGIGFDPDAALKGELVTEMGGNGLASLYKRAGDLGGSCKITSRAGAGTLVSFRIPLHSPFENADSSRPNGWVDPNDEHS